MSSAFLTPPAPAAVPAPAPTPAPTPAPALAPGQQVITGAVGPATTAPQRCYFDRYACEVYAFPMGQDGGVEVTLAWEGHERGMMIQLYRAGAGLVHEDLAPRGSAPRISFRRTDLTAMDYEFRVVNMEPGNTTPFTLTVTRLN